MRWIIDLLRCAYRGNCEQFAQKRNSRTRLVIYIFIIIAAVGLFSEIYGNRQVFAQDTGWSLPQPTEGIKGNLPKYGSSAAAVNHLILGLDQLQNNELASARYNFLFVIKQADGTDRRDDDSAMGGMRLKPLAYLNLGVVDTLEGNANAAIKNYSKAIELNPEYSEAYFNLGALHYKLGNLKKAEEAFLKAIEIQPEYGRAHYSLGFLYLDQKKYDLARLHADKAAEYGVLFKTLKERLAKVGR
jgi:tetratricopeptide (TPR) repeat protein